MTQQTFSEEELLAHVQGTADQALSARILEAETGDRALAAEIAMMRAIKPGLASDDVNPPGELGWRKLEAALAREEMSVPTPASSPRLWKVAAVVFGLGLIGQGAYIAMRDSDATYRTASATDEAHVVAVSFVPEAPMAAISGLLDEAEGRIVDGPGALGLYRIAFDSAQALASARDLFEASELVSLVAEQ